MQVISDFYISMFGVFFDVEKYLKIIWVYENDKLYAPPSQAGQAVHSAL